MDMNIDRADLIAMSYAQLMEFRNQLMQELVDFEKREMTGFRNVNDWDNLNGVNEQYAENLGLMKELINIMREKYNKKTLMSVRLIWKFLRIFLIVLTDWSQIEFFLPLLMR